MSHKSGTCRRRQRLTESDEKAIIERYSINLERMEVLAKEYRVTRQAIWKVLKREGIDTTKAQRIERACRVCGKPVLRRRGRARETEYSYCTKDCYHTYLESLGENYRPSNYHCRVARKIVSELFDGYDPSKGHVVHHVDKDDTHNHPKNLEVYANSGDHLRKHRGQDIQPIWKGVNTH